MKLGIAGDSLSYLVDLGLPVPGQTLFNRDPEIKRENVWVGPVMHRATMLVRRKHSQVDGAQLSVENNDGLFDIALHQPGMLRPLRSARSGG